MNREADSTDDRPGTDHGKWAVVLLVDDQAMVAEGIRRMIADEPDISFHYCADPKKAVREAIVQLADGKQPSERGDQDLAIGNPAWD